MQFHIIYIFFNLQIYKIILLMITKDAKTLIIFWCINVSHEDRI